MIRAGRLKHRITIQGPSSSINAQGGKIKGWSDIETVWASVEPLTGREFFENHQMESEISTRIIIRYRGGLNTHMRVKFGNKYYKIVSIINPQEKNEGLELMALETEDFN